MLWLRGLLFTLGPCVIWVVVPYLLSGSRPLQTGWWRLGWLPLALGIGAYLWCLLNFLAAHGTPAPFFAKKLRAVIGQEPDGLLSSGIYRFSRNPIYVGMLLVIFGQALLFASARIAVYGLTAWFLAHLAVVRLEEPHLRAKHGPAFEEYCRRVPRWLGLPRRGV